MLRTEPPHASMKQVLYKTAVKKFASDFKQVVKVVDGEFKKRYVCQFGITLDERIADGVYFAKCVNLLAYILDNPLLLEDRVDVKVDMVKDK